MIRRTILAVAVVAGAFVTASDADAGRPLLRRAYRPVIRPVVVAPPVYVAPVRSVSYYAPPVATTVDVHRTYRVAPAPILAPAPVVVPVRRFPLVAPPIVRPLGVYVW